MSHSWPRWFARVALTVPGQIPTRFDPRSDDFDELRQAAAARLAAGAASAAARAPFTLSRQILDQRARLDLNPSHPEPLDLDPTVWIQAYRFGLALFLKRPSAFPYLTRRPSLFKSIYKPVLFYSPRPLSFLDFEPAIQPLFFCELDPRTKV